MILVGGFGKSVYLHKCLEKAVDQKIEVLQGSGERPYVNFVYWDGTTWLTTALDGLLCAEGRL